MYLDVGNHSEEPLFSLVVAITFVPGRSQRLLLHQEQVPGPGVHLVQRAGVDRFLENKSFGISEVNTLP